MACGVADVNRVKVSDGGRRDMVLVKAFNGPPNGGARSRFWCYNRDMDGLKAEGCVGDDENENVNGRLCSCLTWRWKCKVSFTESMSCSIFWTSGFADPPGRRCGRIREHQFYQATSSFTLVHDIHLHSSKLRLCSHVNPSSVAGG